jgi:hypothetical protein
MQHVWETGEAHKGIWWGDLCGKNHLENLDVDESIILKCIFKNLHGGGHGLD